MYRIKFHQFLTGRTPLFCAAEEGWHNLVPLLLDQNGCIEITDNTGETPLIVATKNGFSQTMKILLESGAHIFTRDKRGLNALDYAFSVNEKSVQDEQVFDQVLSTMLNNEPKETALGHLHNILLKYNKLRLKECILSLLNRVPELRARKGEFLNDITTFSIFYFIISSFVIIKISGM